MADFRKRRCDTFGTEYMTLNEADKNVAHCYVTSNCWDGNHALVTARLDSLKDNRCSYVRTDLNSGEERLVYEGGIWPDFTVRNGKVYHVEGSRYLATELCSGTTDVLWEAPYPLRGPISITDDGQFGGACWRYEDGSYSIGRINLLTGEHEELQRQSFPPPLDEVSHCMPSPVNPDHIFFCHEGNCCYITNRLWMTDVGKGRTENIFRQRLDQDGNNGECCGHEMWSPDGKGLYFIKYISATITPRGVWYIDLETHKTHSVASGGDYWHVGVSPDGNRLAADTQVPGSCSDVVLIDQELGKEISLIRGATNWTHPCHPHPVFSPDGKKLCFTMLNEEGNTCVAIVELPDIQAE